MKTKSILVMFLLASLAGCSDDVPSDNVNGNATSQGSDSSVLETIGGVAAGVVAGNMISNSLSNSGDDRERRSSSYVPVAPRASSGVVAGGSSSIPSSSAPKANVVSRGGTFGGMNAGS